MQVSRPMRIAIVGDFQVDHDGRPAGAVNVAKLVAALGAKPLLFLGIDLENCSQIPRAPTEWVQTQLRPGDRDPGYIAGLVMSNHPDAVLLADYGRGIITIELQVKISKTGIPWQMEHFIDSFQCETGDWGEAIRWAAHIHKLCGLDPKPASEAAIDLEQLNSLTSVA